MQGFQAGTTKEDLFEMFKIFGEIVSTFVQSNADGTLKDQGFVSFKQPADALRAAETMNKKELPGGFALLVNQHISKKQNSI